MEGDGKDSIEIRPRETEWRHKRTDEQRGTAFDVGVSSEMVSIMKSLDPRESVKRVSGMRERTRYVQVWWKAAIDGGRGRAEPNRVKGFPEPREQLGLSVITT